MSTNTDPESGHKNEIPQRSKKTNNSDRSHVDGVQY
jgi:hypothetical protein